MLLLQMGALSLPTERLVTIMLHRFGVPDPLNPQGASFALSAMAVCLTRARPDGGRVCGHGAADADDGGHQPRARRCGLLASPPRAPRSSDGCAGLDAEGQIRYQLIQWLCSADLGFSALSNKMYRCAGRRLVP
jgi:hypothetical protein